MRKKRKTKAKGKKPYIKERPLHYKRYIKGHEIKLKKRRTQGR